MAFLCRLLSRLRNDMAGNVLAIVGAGLVPLTIMIGSGVDLSRAYMAKSKMQSACDAASLAARRVMKNDVLNQSVQDTGTEFFNFNYPQGLYGSQTFTPVITKPEAGVIRVAASSAIPTAVMHLFGFKTLPVAVSCDASLNFVNTDIVLVLDVTGSMNDTVGGTKKIVALQEAVMALYDELAPIQTQLQAQGLRLRYSIVPYSSTVNVGKLLYDANPNYLRTTTNVPSRVANFNTPVYTAQPSTSTGEWQVYSGTRSDSQCQNYVNAGNTSAGTAPNPTTVTKYQGTASNNNYNQSQNWGYPGAADTSGTSRSCRRWKIVETTTYKTEYKFTDWTYQQVDFDVTNYVKKPSAVNPAYGKLTYAINGSGLVNTSDSYTPQQLAASGTGTTLSDATWRGCIEERDTVTTIDGGTSMTIPSGAYDLNINLIPNNEETRWRPMVPDLIFYRAAGSTSANSTDGSSSQKGGLMDSASPGGGNESAGFWACPSEARRLAVWDRAALDSYTKGLQTIGGTYHDIGMIWGARMSSTSGVFGDGCDVYNGMPCNRHIIFMTDGDQTAYCNVYGAYGIEVNDKRVKGANNCTSDSQTNSVTAQLRARHEQRFRMACNAAKNLNTSVWVIGFDTALNSNLVGCASNPGQADTAANRTALIAKFRQIGNQIGALRLTQ